MNLAEKGVEFDVFVEAKRKEQAIFFLYEKYDGLLKLDIRTSKTKKEHQKFEYKTIDDESLNKILMTRKRNDSKIE